jgi:hypothetical protein
MKRDQHLATPCYLLNLDGAACELCEGATHRCHILGRRESDLDDAAASEIDRIVEAGVKEKNHRGDAEDRGGDEASEAPAPELDGGAVRYEAQWPEHQAPRDGVGSRRRGDRAPER